MTYYTTDRDREYSWDVSCDGEYIGRVAKEDIPRIDQELNYNVYIGEVLNGLILPGDETTHRNEPVWITVLLPNTVTHVPSSSSAAGTAILKIENK